MNLETLLSSHLEELEPYQAPDWQSSEELSLIRLDANENPYGPGPGVEEALVHFAEYGLYPDYRELTRAVAEYAGVNPEQVVLGNGGDEILDMTIRLFVEPGQGVIVCPPAFDMYAISTRAHRGRVLQVPRGEDFALDVEGIEALVNGAQVQPKVLFLTTPGNPDGGVIPLDTIRRLLQLPIGIVVDEAYIEFGGESAVPLLADHPQLVILRTFSKWAGLAGLRLGYALAHPQLAANMERLRLPYNVSAAAMVAALATFANLAPVQDTIGRIISERERLQSILGAMPGVSVLPSQGNFCLVRLAGRNGKEVAAALSARGVAVRSYADAPLSDCLRISIGRPEQMDALLAALGEVLDLPLAVRLPGKDAGPSQAPDGVSRVGAVHRQTGETDIQVSLALDGSGRYEIDTGLGFLDHMLAQIASHGLFDLTVQAQGDLHIDEHHTVEDVAIALGQALDQALGERRGIVRMGHVYAPLDEALARVVIDCSGRPYAVIEAEFSTPRLGSVGTDLIRHFFETLAVHGRLSLHAQVMYGYNDHHKAEAMFKALGRALDAATQKDPRRQQVPSTKGVL